MGAEDDGNMGFQHSPSLNGANPFYGSGWDPLVSLTHSENFGASSMVPHSGFSNPAYPVVMENQTISGSSHLVHYQSDSGLGEMVPKIPCFGSGGFSEMVTSFGLSEFGTQNTTNGPQSQEECRVSEDGDSPNGKKKRRSADSHSPFNPNKNGEGEQQKDTSGDSSEYIKEQDEKKQKIELNTGMNLRGKHSGKHAKDNSDSGEAPKENYIHMRAKRGQATNSHSLAERVRRERISERMKLLQELVPGCNKITGKAVMLDEIINYVQSLQQQVEFLSMKLATVNPEMNIDIERILSKDILPLRGSNAAVLGFGPGLSSSHPYLPGTLSGMTNATPQFHPMPPQTVWDSELQSLLQMEFDSNPAINNLGPNGRAKLEL